VTRAGALPWIPNSYQWSLTGSLIGKRPVKKRRAGRLGQLANRNVDMAEMPKHTLRMFSSLGTGWSESCQQIFIGGAIKRD
jgi:hypothetical protein